MIVGAAGGQQRPHYALGIAVAVLIVAGYVLVESNPPAPAPTPTPSAAPVVVLPSGFNPGGVELSAPPSPATTPAIAASPPRHTATPRPTHHVLHSGPPLH